MLSTLCLDLGTKNGWALRTSDGAITSGTAEFRNDRWQGGGMRFLKFKQWLTELKATAGGIDVVYYEEVRRHMSTDAAHLYGGLLGVLQTWAEHHKIPYGPIPIGTWKRAITGKGNANKAAVLEAVRARGYSPVDDNEGDAIAMLLYLLDSNAEFIEDFTS